MPPAISHLEEGSRQGKSRRLYCCRPCSRAFAPAPLPHLLPAAAQSTRLLSAKVTGPSLRGSPGTAMPLAERTGAGTHGGTGTPPPPQNGTTLTSAPRDTAHRSAHRRLPHPPPPPRLNTYRPAPLRAPPAAAAPGAGPRLSAPLRAAPPLSAPPRPAPPHRAAAAPARLRLLSVGCAARSRAGLGDTPRDGGGVGGVTAGTRSRDVLGFSPPSCLYRRHLPNAPA